MIASSLGCTMDFPNIFRNVLLSADLSAMLSTDFILVYMDAPWPNAAYCTCPIAFWAVIITCSLTCTIIRNSMTS